jgi:hypothetical protein
MIHTIKRIVKSAIFSVVKPPLDFGKNSYAQAGEDVVVNFLFGLKKVNKPSYLEIGVFLPDIHNNTYLFYKNGSRGVLVDADQTYTKRIKEIRPEDKFINVGVGDEGCGIADFYIFMDTALNTFDKEEALFRDKIGTHKIIETKRVSIKPINQIISENFKTQPDFLSIDTEGLDLSILRTLDFQKFPIPVICAETCTYSENHIKPKDHRIAEFMTLNGYFVYADTYINTIFVNINWFYSK